MVQLVKNLPTNVEDLGSIPGLERSPGRRHGNSLQYFSLENPHGQRSLAGYSPWGRKESDTTDRLSTAHNIAQRQSVEGRWGMDKAGQKVKHSSYK